MPPRKRGGGDKACSCIVSELIIQPAETIEHVTSHNAELKTLRALLAATRIWCVSNTFTHATAFCPHSPSLCVCNVPKNRTEVSSNSFQFHYGPDCYQGHDDGHYHNKSNAPIAINAEAASLLWVVSDQRDESGNITRCQQLPAGTGTNVHGWHLN